MRLRVTLGRVILGRVAQDLVHLSLVGPKAMVIGC
jgi:hypothetical protein